MVAHAFNSITQEVEAGEGQLVYRVSSRTGTGYKARHRNPVLKERKERKKTVHPFHFS